MIKGLRKSFKEKSKSTHSSISSPKSFNDKKSSISSAQEIQITNNNLLQSPKKVIKALYDYKPQGPGELEFNKGDFFHVIGNEDDPEWYEATNPSKNTRGMVPVPYFEVFGKTRPISNRVNTTSSTSSPPRSNKKLSTDSMPTSRSSRSSSSNMLYAIVLYQFKAERSDELDVNIGENIILCAHHNYEWFIAKPIDRLGGPGLVPVSYVSVINILTGNSTGNDVVDDINGANLPTVDDWKNKNARYKASSIPLGNVEEDSTIPVQQEQQEGHRESRAQSQFTFENETQVDESIPYIVDASVDSFNVDNGRYWFHVNAELNNGESRSLCRYYEDFYDFQIKLLEYFPNEAGRQQQQSKRILPFIPGPLTYVTDKITKKRQVDLNDYVKELISLPKYISQSNYVKKLFETRHEYDHLIDSDNQFVQLERNKVVNSGYYEDEDPNSTIVKDESVKTLNAESGYKINHQQQGTPVKLKFYYRDDIFALMINKDVLLDELREKIRTRIYDDDDDYDGKNDFKIFIKNNDDEPGKEILSNDDVSHVLKNKLKIIIDDE